jgi:ankyrin repeat protein
MPSAPELRRRTLALALCALALCLLSLASPTPAQKTTARSQRPPQPATPPPATARRIAQQILPAVVLITMEGNCYGSGFFVTTDLVATNKHVLGCGGHGTVTVAGRQHPLPILATWSDPLHDLALVRVSGAHAQPLPLSLRSWPAVGDDIYVAGNPEGLSGTFSRGIISSLRQSEGLIQFDAPVSPGSSGGPVVDTGGRVVGVTVASVRQGQNLNFAVPAQYLPALLDRALHTPPDTAAAETPGKATPTAGSSHTAPSHTSPANPVLQRWAAQPDWTLFTSDAIGDTTIPEGVQALLTGGLNVNARDGRGRTALHVAAMLGQTELSRYLLDKGADINARDTTGRTPLMVAASLGGFDLFRSVQMTAPWQHFWTDPLCQSEMSGGGVATSATQAELTTWYAIARAQRTLVQLLLRAGADVNAADHDGHTVLDYAARGGLTDFDQLIRETGRLHDQQSVCSLKLAQSPSLRGFHLGMSLREVTNRFRRFTLPETSSCGRLNLDFNAAWGTLRDLALKPEDLMGVSRIRLAFVDEKLAYIRVTYSAAGNGWNSLKEYRAALSGSLGLTGEWHIAGSTGNFEESWDQAYVMGCEGFKVMAGYDTGPFVELHDVVALGTLLQRRVDEAGRQKREAEQEQERRRRAFHP